MTYAIANIIHDRVEARTTVENAVSVKDAVGQYAEKLRRMVARGNTDSSIHATLLKRYGELKVTVAQSEVGGGTIFITDQRFYTIKLDAEPRVSFSSP